MGSSLSERTWAAKSAALGDDLLSPVRFLGTRGDWSFIPRAPWLARAKSLEGGQPPRGLFLHLPPHPPLVRANVSAARDVHRDDSTLSGRRLSTVRPGIRHRAYVEW